ATPALRKQLSAPNGSARVGVAKTLSWAYSGDKKSMVAWRAFLKSQAARSGLSGDGLASWYMALAYAAQLPPAALSASPGLNWVQKAFKAAKDPALRLKCLKWIVNAHIKLADFGAALD